MTFSLTKITGLLDNTYDVKTGEATHHHLPSIIYGTVMKLSYIAASIFYLYQSYHEFNECNLEQKVWQIIKLAVNFLYAIYIIILCVEMLCKRKEFSEIVSAYLKYRKMFPQKLHYHKSQLKTNRMIILVTIFVFYKIPFAIRYQLNRPNLCNPGKTNVTALIFWVFLWSLTLGIESLMMGVIMTGDIVMERAVLKLKKVSMEVHRLQASHLSQVYKEKWRETINQLIKELIDQQKMIRCLMQKLIDSCICTFMISLFDRSLQLIFIAAVHIMLLDKPGHYEQKLKNFIFLLFLLLSLMNTFYISHKIAAQYQLLKDIAYKLSLKLKYARSKNEMILQNSLDTLIVELSQEYFRTRFVHIFKIDLSTFFALICICINQLLVLLQKIMERNINDHRQLVREKQEAIRQINALLEKWDQSISQN